MIKVLRLLFFPFAILFFIVTEFRNFLFQTRVIKGTEFDRPVICIGNLSTGGTGKTPMIEYSVRLLVKNEIKPAVLSRGYGRKLLGFRMVEIDSKTTECGDEPLQIKQKFPEVTVAVSENRSDGIVYLVKEKEDLQCILLDDAMQHRSVKPSLIILTTSFFQPFFSDFILPVGNLREMRKNASRAKVIVVTKCPDWLTDLEVNFYTQSIRKYSKAEIYFSQIKYGEIKPVFGNGKPITLTHHVLLVTGIAQTESLVEFLEQKSKVNHLRFPDHHRFELKDIQKIVNLFNSFANDDKIIITTEKDAKRFQSLDGEMIQSLKNLPIYFIEMESEILFEKEKFDQTILSHVTSFE
jgi:tetraacyldisaccharide 4'-kinase